MYFNFSLFVKSFAKAFLNELRIFPKTSFRRLFVIIIILIFYIPLEIFTHLCFFLDEVFYRNYRTLNVQKPVFIMGVPRSGTSYLYNLLSTDQNRYSSMKLWEILYAPSIIQKKMLLAVAGLDKTMGHPLKKTITFIESKIYSDLNVMHTLSSFSVEEDEPILLHAFASAYLHVLFPDQRNLLKYAQFDIELAEREQSNILRFYKRCVQKHLFVFGRNKQYLAKNPAFNTKVMSLSKLFPDSKFICPVRNPMQVVPSTYSLFSYFYKEIYKENHSHLFNDDYLNLLQCWYYHPMNSFKQLVPNKYVLIKYDDLVAHAFQTIKDIYQTFNFELSPVYKERLKKMTEKSRSYKSRHKYNVNQFNINEKIIKTRFKLIFEQYNFS